MPIWRSGVVRHRSEASVVQSVLRILAAHAGPRVKVARASVVRVVRASAKVVLASAAKVVLALAKVVPVLVAKVVRPLEKVVRALAVRADQRVQALEALVLQWVSDQRMVIVPLDSVVKDAVLVRRADSADR